MTVQIRQVPSMTSATRVAQPRQSATHRLRAPLLALALAGTAQAADANLVFSLPGALLGHDLEIELARRGDAILPHGWVAQGWTHGLGQVQVQRQSRDGTGRPVLELAVTCLKDPWRPAIDAAITVVLGEGDANYSGTLRCGAESQELSGSAQLRETPPWPEPVGKAAAGHPRLILTPETLPALRERLAAAGPGQVIAQRLRQAAAARYTATGTAELAGHHGKFRTWPAVACGMLFQLTGEADWARQAQEIVAAGLPDEGGQDIHMAPRLGGMALAYDLCATAWDPAFRAQVAADIRRRITALDLTGGFPKAANLAPLSNHNGVRLGSIGLAALALLGDGPDPALEWILTGVQRRMRQHLEEGYGETGLYLEGRFYKSMTLERCFGPFLWSHRQALGSRLDAAGSAAWFLLGDEVLGATPGSLTVSGRAYDVTSGDMLPAVALVFGGATVQPAQLGVLRGLLERLLPTLPPIDAKCEEGELMAACYLPLAFPWDAAAQDPAALPRELWDARYGRHLLRPAYGSALDPLLMLNTKVGLIRGGHERGGWNAGVEWHCAGGRRLDGTWLPAVVGKPTAVNPTFGGVLVERRQDGPLRWHALIELDRAYYQHPTHAVQQLQAEEKSKGVLDVEPKETELPKGRELVDRLLPTTGGSAIEVPGWGWWIDHGVRARRALAVDGGDGANRPMLLAIRDRVAIADAVQPPELVLDVPLADRSTAPQASGAGFVIGQAPGILAGLASGEGARCEATSTSATRLDFSKGPPRKITTTTWKLTVHVRGELLTVLALGGDAAPTIVVEPAGIRVGDRILRQDGDRIRWEGP